MKLNDLKSMTLNNVLDQFEVRDVKFHTDECGNIKAISVVYSADPLPATPQPR